MKKIESVYWDANCFIYLLQGAVGERAVLKTIAQMAQDGKLKII